MKVLKVTLTLWLFIHVYSNILVNLIPIKKIINEKTSVSAFGNFFYKNVFISYPKYFEKGINIYSNYTGTNRGYEYFSPNVPNTSIDVLFFNGKDEIFFPLLTQESKIKLLTAKYFFCSYLLNDNMRQKIIKSICTRLFVLNPKISKIEVYLVFTKFKRLENIKFNELISEQKKVLAFVVYNRE